MFLAACLAQQPRLLLLDEPATFLDVDQQLQCFAMLRDEADRGAACLAVTHDINLALTFCTRLIVLAERTRRARPAGRRPRSTSRSGCACSRDGSASTTTAAGTRPWVRYQ